MPNETDSPAPEIVGARIIDAISEPFEISGSELRVRVSIGIATGRDTPENMLRDADIAMYRAKATKRGGLCIFEPDMQADTVRDLELRNELLGAVARREITVVYQPIVTLADGRISAVEALARWTHPTHGPIPPDVFIPLAESAGVIQDIGSSVLHDSCAALAQWRASHPEHSELQVSVNVSPDQLGQGLLDDIERALAESNLPATALILELTETHLLHDSDTALALLAQLRDLGVQIAIDDFGTGYSSLRYLRRFPVDVLKIAKPFIDGIDQPGRQEWAFAPPDHRPREHARSRHRGRGHRGRGTARPARRAGLRLRPGLPVLASRQCRDDRRAAGRGRGARRAPARCLTTWSRRPDGATIGSGGSATR